MEKAIHDPVHLAVENLLRIWPDRKFLVAVSGGMDSMVLADALHRISADFAIAHCNFHLRGGDSDADQKLVEDWAAGHGIICHTGHFPLTGQKSGIQESARTARYRYFDQLKSQFGYEILLTAHHRDDLEETFFLNLIRGSGLRGLDVLSSKEKRAIRPLQNLSKKEIEQYAIFHKVSWREDDSNFKNDYARNKLRNQVFPKLAEIKAGFGSSMSQSMELISDLRLYMDQRLEEWKVNFVRNDAGRIKILPFPASELTLFRYYASGLGFNYDTIQNICKNLNSAGRTFRSSKGLTLRMARDYWVLSEDSQAVLFTETVIDPVSGNVTFGNFELEIQKINGPDPKLESTKENWSILADCSEIKFPLILRQFVAGDRICIPGMQGKHKKLKKIFNEAGTDLQTRAELPIWVCGNEIVWVPGHAISEKISNYRESEKLMLWTCKRIPLVSDKSQLINYSEGAHH